MSPPREIRAVAVPLALAVAACSGNESEPPEIAADEASAEEVGIETVTGQVRQVGNVPFTYTVIDTEQGGVRVLGIYESELERLAGARVEAVGQPTEAGDGGPGAGLRVADYSVLSVDGAEPRVGMLLQTPDGRHFLYTRDGRNAVLTGVPEGLREKAGAKIWVVTGDEGSVQRYGVIREP